MYETEFIAARCPGVHLLEEGALPQEGLDGAWSWSLEDVGQFPL